LRCALALAVVALGSALAVPAGAVNPEVVTVDESTRVLDLGPHLALLEDAGQEYTIEDVVATGLAQQFRPAGNLRGLGFTRSAWWVRFHLRNASSAPVHLVVRQDYPLIDYLDMWWRDEGGRLAHVATGDRLPFDQRPLEHNEFLMPMVLPAGADQSIHLRFQTDGSLNLGLRLFERDALLSAVGREQLLWGAFYGSVLLLALSNLLLFALVRDRAFLYYFVYLLSYCCYMAAYNGLSFQFLWPGLPELVNLSQLALLPLSLYFLLQFSRTFLALEEVSERLDFVARVLQLLLLLCIPLAPVASYRSLILPLAGLTLATIAFLLVAAIACVLAGRIAARYYLSGLSIFLVGVLLYMLKTFGLLPHNFVTQHGYQLGSLAEFLLLSLALGVRVSELKRAGLTDPLTGLGNRRHFDEQAAHEFAAARTRGTGLALLVLDLDHFKRLNDTHGHVVGDRALQTVARILRQQVRKPNEAFRYGGEEFVVVLPGLGIPAAHALAERLREHVAVETGVGLTVSIGVAGIGERSVNSADDLFRCADAALYTAKNSGRNRVVDFAGDAADPRRRSIDSGAAAA
jgi:diguanylate cyclase (GGDEF)-like protein